MIKKYNTTIKIVFLLFVALVFTSVKAQDSFSKNVDLYVSPRSGTFSVGSTFNVGVYINTKNQNINTINLDLQFDPKKITVIKPTGGNSIMGIWVEAPVYDNTKGYIHMSGVVPEGIITNSGLITNITFKVIATGDTQVSLKPTTEVLLNDGLGTKANTVLSKAKFTFVRNEESSVFISSDTHPFQDVWYNNNNPVFSWESDKNNVLGYSVLLDSNPGTESPLVINTNENNKSYLGVKDGVQYLHVKANSSGSWSRTAHFTFRVDTEPPLSFKPKINLLNSKEGEKQYIVFFNTSDDTSGINHYEVGVVNVKNKNALPVFIQAESPYVLPLDTDKNSRIIVRAYDNAGNVEESYVSTSISLRNIIIIIIFVIIFILLLVHYLFGHHIGRNIVKAYKFFKQLVKKDHEIQDIQAE
jgi:hypothetical protein